MTHPFSIEHAGPDGSPTRYNPCAPLHYVTNLAGAPPGAAADVAGAIARVSAATGIAFVSDGSTTELPSLSRPAFQARYGTGWAPILIAWATPATSNVLAGGNVVGEGTSSWLALPSSPSKTAYVTGEVAIDANASRVLRDGFGSGQTIGELLLHELGHVMGLGHVSDPTQVMYPDLLPLPGAAYGAGDLAGMRALGASHGCLPVPGPLG